MSEDDDGGDSDGIPTALARDATLVQIDRSAYRGLGEIGEIVVGRDTEDGGPVIIQLTELAPADQETEPDLRSVQ